MGRTNEALWSKAKAEAKAKMGGKHSDDGVVKFKLCTTCRIEKPMIDFTRNKNQPSGYMGYCKGCNNARNKKYRRNESTLERACKRIFSYAKKRAHEKFLAFEIDAKFLEELYLQQNGLCGYTGDVLNLQACSPQTVSIDRINSSIGYTKKNVCLVTWEVNNAKQSRSVEAFKLLCQKVVSHGAQ